MDEALFDWFGETDTPAEIANRVRRPDEIKAHSTEDFETEIQRLDFLLRRGLPIQKAAVFRSLPKVLSEPGSSLILESFIQVVPSCDESIKAEAGSGLYKASKSATLRPSQADMLLPLTVLMLCNLRDEARQAWLEAFNEIVRIATPEAVDEHCTKACISIGEFSNSINCRETSAHMLGGIAEALRDDFSNKLINRSLRLAQDPSYEVRKAMVQELKFIFPAVNDQSYKSQMVQELLKLARDEVIAVKLEALTTLASIIDSFSYDVNINQVLPLIEEEVLNSDDETVLSHVSRFLGTLISKLEAELSDDQYRPKVLEFICRLSTNISPEVRASVASNFPLIIQTFGQMCFFTELTTVFVRLVRDPDAIVLRGVVCKFSEVVQNLGNSSTLHPDFLYLLNTPSCIIQLLPQISNLAKCFASREIYNGVAKRLIELLAGQTPWRAKVNAIDCIKQLVEEFDYLRLSQLSSELQLLVSTATKPVAVAAVELLSLLLRKLSRQERIEVFEALIGLSKSTEFKKRLLFLDFCVFFTQFHSRQMFKDKLIDSILSLTYDAVADVRFKLARTFPTFRLHICNDDTQTSAKLMEALNHLLMDPHTAVSKCAGETQLAFISRAYWKKLNQDEDQHKDVIKRNKELEQERRERLIDEEEKKRVVEKLAQKAKMDYLYSKSKVLPLSLKRSSMKTLPRLERPKIRNDSRRLTESNSSFFRSPRGRTLEKSLTLPRLT